MMKMQPIQYGFSAGEITPRLYGNTQSEVYRNALAEAYNMIILAHGPVLSRDGSLFLGEAGNPDDIRLIPFNTSTGDGYAIEFGPLYMRVYDPTGRIDLNEHNHILDPNFSREFLLWNDKSVGGIVTFVLSENSAHLDNLTGSNIASINQNITPFEAGHVGFAHSMAGSFAGDGQLHIEVGTAEGLADVLDVTVTAPGDFSFSFVPTVIDHWVQFTNSGADNTTAIIIYPSLSKDGTAIEVVTPYTAEELPEIQYEMLTAERKLLLVHPNHPPQQLDLLLPGPDFQLSAIIFVSPPSNWATSNYPSVITIYQGRLWLAGTPNSLSTMWASQSGDYFNFALGTGLPNEGIAYSLAAADQIKWVRGQKDLLMGTDLNEYRISSSGGLIIPSDINIQQQSAYGSAHDIQGENIGDQVLYVSHDNAKLRGLTFDTFQQGWYSPDITWQAQHLTNSRIKELHFAKDPFTLILCLLEDGTLAVCTYDRSQESLGWSTFDLANMDVKTLCVINDDTGSTIIGAGKQENGKMIILLSPGTLGVPADMDSTVLRPIEAGNIVTGLDHLDGMTASVKVDGAVHPDRLVSSGQITLDYDGDVALVGLGFSKRITTLPLDVGSKQGSGAGNLKHWAKIYVRIINSAIPKINGNRPPTRLPSTLMNTPEALRDDDIQATDLGRTRRAQITIEQDLPLRMEILNIFGIEGQDLL